jgi:hypothetical protein
LISGGHVDPSSGDEFPVACASATFAAAMLMNVARIRMVGRKGNSSRTCRACYSTRGRAKRSGDVAAQRQRFFILIQSRERPLVQREPTRRLDTMPLEAELGSAGAREDPGALNGPGSLSPDRWVFGGLGAPPPGANQRLGGPSGPLRTVKIPRLQRTIRVTHAALRPGHVILTWILTWCLLRLAVLHHARSVHRELLCPPRRLRHFPGLGAAIAQCLLACSAHALLAPLSALCEARRCQRRHRNSGGKRRRHVCVPTDHD